MSARFDVLEDGASVQREGPHLDAGSLEQREFVRRGRWRVDAQDAANAQPEPGRGKRTVGRRSAQPPASRIVAGEIAGGGAGHHELDRRRRAARRIRTARW
jgi:hypothetical protein